MNIWGKQQIDTRNRIAWISASRNFRQMATSDITEQHPRAQPNQVFCQVRCSLIEKLLQLTATVLVPKNTPRVNA
jgi:hypothetical protein